MYRGVPLAEQAPLVPLSLAQVMVGHPAPMPVGTTLTVRVADQAAIRVVVVAVRETHGDAAAAASGMILGPVADASVDERTGWDRLVDGAPAAPPATSRRTTDELAAGQIAEATATAAAARLSTSSSRGASSTPPTPRSTSTSTPHPPSQPRRPSPPSPPPTPTPTS